MKVSRRNFLKLAGAASGACALGASSAASAATKAAARDESALLVDTTRCLGCRGCEAACSESNRLPSPEKLGDPAVFEARRTTTPTAFTVVNRASLNPARYVKAQCMHCVEPACASACLARALDKTPEGPVIYHPERCMGCRYCMVACPFEVPRFEYDSPTPYIKKCDMCYARQKRGFRPACVEACPSGALTFGTRAELLEEAKRRVYQNPERYQPHVYGEREAGGTNVLYIGDLDSAKLGLKQNLEEKGYPEYTKGALGLVPFIMTLWPPLLMGIHHFSKSREASSAGAPTTSEEKNHG